MNNFFTSLFKATLFGTIIATVPSTINAQVSVRDINQYLDRKNAGKNVSLWNRYEIGYGETFSNGSTITYTRTRNISGGITGTTTGKSFNYRSTSGYSAVYFPLTYIGQNSALVLNTGVYARGSSWDLGNTSLDPTATTINSAAEVQIGVPIGVDYIFGGEVTCNKQDKVTLRAGAGAMPYIAVGSLADNSEKYAKLGMKPYVKAELGFFLGVEWKIRGMVIAGSRTLYNYQVGDYNLNNSSYYASYSFTVRPSYILGFSVFPFSFGWENDKW
jgi:hypothetical protein